MEPKFAALCKSMDFGLLHKFRVNALSKDMLANTEIFLGLSLKRIDCETFTQI